jgi:hypothetical protein
VIYGVLARSAKSFAKSCCSALISIIAKDSQCLCNLLSNDVLKQLGIKVPHAKDLPRNAAKVKSFPHPISCISFHIYSPAFFISAVTAGSSYAGKNPTSTSPRNSYFPLLTHQSPFPSVKRE